MKIISQNNQAIVVQSEVFITNLNGAQIVLTALIALLQNTICQQQFPIQIDRLEPNWSDFPSRML